MKTDSKKISRIILSLLMAGLNSLNQPKLYGQTTGLPKIAVLSVDIKDPAVSPVQCGNYLRVELAKIQKYEVLDRYDQEYMIKKSGQSFNDCYGKICLLEAAKVLNTDKMFTGVIDNYGETILLTLNLIDTKTQTVEKTFVKEYLNVSKEIPMILSLAVSEMYGITVNTELLEKYTKKFNLENEVNNSGKNRLNLEGPRFGAVYVGGTTGKVLQSSKNQGGYGAYPVMFQMGYQFETQYLTQGKLQALFEFLPMISGIEQGIFVPSITLLHGLRNNHNGLEFAFGPTARLTKLAKGYYDSKGNWHLEKEWDPENGIPYNQFVTRVDSRGYYAIEGAFVFALGFTIKSGTLNIPVNSYVIPSNKGIRIGASFGFNTKK